MNVKLKIWRQAGPKEKGGFVTYDVETTEDTSFLETLDILNESLVEKGEEPVAFDHDCCSGCCQRILQTKLCFLHLCLGSCTYADNCNAACQLSQSLLKFLFIEI